MTKFMQWLTIFGCIFCVWAALVTNKVDVAFTRQYYTLILYSPILLIILFGVYAVGTVLHKTLTFNNCEADSIQLQKEIKQAREDLKRLGFVFKSR